MKHILMSIRPRFVNEILDGRKTFELRRKRVSAEPGDVICIYSTSPQKTLSAVCSVREVLWMDLISLWDKVKDSCGVSFEEFMNYFQGQDNGCAVELKNVQTLPEAVKLTEIRNIDPGFRPPQSYCFVRPESILAQYVPNTNFF